MEVILNKTIDNLGLEGDLVNVKPGYARNYLIPQKIAMSVNKQNLARLQQQKEAIEARLEKERKEAGTLSDKLSSVTVEIARRVGDKTGSLDQLLQLILQKNSKKRALRLIAGQFS